MTAFVATPRLTAEARLEAKYGTIPVPRYTSYPTAPHFQKSFDPAVYQGWLQALDKDAPLSLYIHIPYCWQVCWYCGCNMRLAKRKETVTDYVQLLLREIDQAARLMGDGRRVSHLHFGGGTPTSIAPRELRQIMSLINRRFDLSRADEVAIEADPRTLSDDMMGEIGAAGFNRASFGIQEFSDKVQKAINRIQPAERVEECVHGLRSAGVTAINFDVLYGLPYQTALSLEETLKECITMVPDRFAVFGYAHVPWMAKRQRMIDEAALPDIAARREQAQTAQATLTAAGYTPVGLDHFALPSDSLARRAADGELRRNFQGYTTDQADTLIGFGVSAISALPGGFVQAPTDIRRWADTLEAGRLPVARGIATDAEDRLRADIITALMCTGEVDLAAVAGAHGFSPRALEADLETLIPFAEDGLVSIEGSEITLTSAGMPYQRLIAGAFDAYRQHGGRHSIAV